MTDPPAVDKRARRYKCCKHCAETGVYCEPPDDHFRPCDCDEGSTFAGGAE